jgi:putative Mn2+ efflux pump MntP
MGAVWVLAVALAIDAAAVSAGLGAAGGAAGRLLGVSTVFGLFQAAMAGLGAWGGTWIVTYAAAWDHWLAFALLTGVGGSMLRGGEEDAEVGAGPTMPWRAVLGLAVATSLDALASGVTLPVMAVPLLPSLLVIGGVTAVLALAAGWVGRWAGAYLGAAMERVAGGVLMAMGAKILVEHLWTR